MEKEITMNLQEIKQAIADGRKVYWSNPSYEVIKDNLGQYLIYRKANEYCIGLTHRDGVTLNGKESEFFVID